MKEIKVIMNSGGCIQSVYVSEELKDADVEIIDFCTTDEEEIEGAEEAWKDVEAREKKGLLVPIY